MIQDMNKVPRCTVVASRQAGLYTNRPFGHRMRYTKRLTIRRDYLCDKIQPLLREIYWAHSMGP